MCNNNLATVLVPTCVQQLNSSIFGALTSTCMNMADNKKIDMIQKVTEIAEEVRNFNIRINSLESGKTVLKNKLEKNNCYLL